MGNETSLQGRRILVLEDTTPMRKLIAKNLQQQGASVAEAGDGMRAWEMLREAAAAGQPFEAVVADISLPGMSGIELLKKVRGDPTLKQTVFVMATASRRREDIVACGKLGVSSFLAKPIAMNALYDAVAKALAAGAPEPTESADNKEIGEIAEMPGKNMAVYRVTGDLTSETRQQFRDAIRQLLSSSAAEIAIDLTTARSIDTALYLGTLRDAGEQAKAAGKSLNLFVPPRLSEPCQRHGLYQVAKIVPGGCV